MGHLGKGDNHFSNITRTRLSIGVAPITQVMHGEIFLGYLRGRYKAPVPMANIHFFSQYDQKISQSEGQLYVDQ